MTSINAGITKFQSTHPHGVRPSFLPNISMILAVSIHAPTRGATPFGINGLSGSSTFQSTHPHGVRLAARGVSEIWIKFQSTHPHGVRPSTSSLTLISYFVSIHAPTRGATASVSEYFLGRGSFNPRTHTGCDNTPTPPCYIIQVSIHAPTRGATTGVILWRCEK